MKEASKFDYEFDESVVKKAIWITGSLPKSSSPHSATVSDALEGRWDLERQDYEDG